MLAKILHQLITTTVVALFVTAPTAAAKPVKVFILVGQSNMQGHAAVTTFDHVGMDPKTAPLLKEMRNADGTARVCDHVWISSIGNDGTNDEHTGKLTAGYGAMGRGSKIGPELTFGIRMQQAYPDQPILLIKTAWGGKSLHTDFRSPSAGPYEFREGQIESLKKRNKDVEQARKDRAEATGKYYRLMLDHVQHVLKDVGRVCPEYDQEAGYELSGFVWFQGWNDMVDSGVYPQRGQPGGYSAYSKNMAHFIRDVRSDLDSPKLPFVIGVLGVNGPIAKYGPSQQRYKGIHGGFRSAMAAPASMPEFEGNVAAVLTENYWDHELEEVKSRGAKINAKSRELREDKNLTRADREAALEKFRAEVYSDRDLEILKGSSNAGFHYNGSAKIMAQIGVGFAEAILEMQEKAN